ncbi:MAG TPA: hypothetical protein VKT72_07805 [Candidatus Baltobacteraceae bacterium]|nr:hypothetical protein [Candidatus Baltobacteraceae bacterium]
MRIVITCNGPGESAGWLRPLLHELYRQAPESDVHVFYVPDDYATGREAQTVREWFPAAHAYDPKTYLKVAFGARIDGVPEGADAVLYLGGDLMHAARLHKRFGGALLTYKFSRERYAKETARAFAVDSANVEQLAAWGVARDRIEQTGNLAIDGALMEARAQPEEGAPDDGVLFMPGSRRFEVEQMIPFFFTTALRMREEQPSLPMAFGISPFTELSAVRAAVEAGGDPMVFARRGSVIENSHGAFLAFDDGAVRFPIVRRALAAADAARLVVTIPGTKAIELAAIGKPAISCSPANKPEGVTINGPLTYLDRIPLIGVPAKRAIVVAYARRFRFHTQPNIDANAMLIDELHGTLTPGRVARVALQRFADRVWLEQTAQALGGLYREHVGAASRTASALLALDRG